MPPSPVVIVLAKSKLYVPIAPHVPSALPLSEPPQPHAESSINTMPRSSQIFLISTSRAGVPSMCTTITARVRSVILANKSCGSILKVSSISQHTGTARASIIASAVATNVKLCVITSSVGCKSSTASATRNADVPEVTASACGTSMNLANATSKSRTL